MHRQGGAPQQRQLASTADLLASPAADVPASAAAAGAGGQGAWGAPAAAPTDPVHALLPAWCAPALAGDALQLTGGELAAVYPTAPLLAAAGDLGMLPSVALEALLPSALLPAARACGEVLGSWWPAASPVSAAAAAAPEAGEAATLTTSMGSCMQGAQFHHGHWGSAAMDAGASSAGTAAWPAASSVLTSSPSACGLAAGQLSVPLAPAPLWAAGGDGSAGGGSTARRKLRERALSMPDLSSKYAALL